MYYEVVLETIVAGAVDFQVTNMAHLFAYPASALYIHKGLSNFSFLHVTAHNHTGRRIVVSTYCNCLFADPLSRRRSCSKKMWSV